MRLEKIITQALEKADDNRYLLSNAVSKRAEELHKGAKPLVEADIKKEKFTDIALREIAEGKLVITNRS